MTDNYHYDVSLVMDWPHYGGGTALRRNTTGFATIKQLAAHADNTLKINAFLYVFMAAAKNLDLFSRVDTASIKQDIEQIENKMKALEDLERDGKVPNDNNLLTPYKNVREVGARSNARDEQRTLATLLFSGPSTAKQIEEDLGIHENLATRVLQL